MPRSCSSSPLPSSWRWFPFRSRSSAEADGGPDMHLVRDVLDKKVLDRKRQPMGRVDGLVIEIADDGSPRVVGLEIGAVALAYRLGPSSGAWLARVAEHLGGRKHGASFRIPWSAVTDV